MPEPLRPERDVINSQFNAVLAVTTWVVSGLIAVSLFFVADRLQLLYLVPLAFIGLLIWEGLWRPMASIDDDSILVTNVFRTIRVPWNALVHVDTKFALTLYTPGRKIEVWVAPAPGRSFGQRNVVVGRDARRVAPQGSASVRPGELAASESGGAAYLVRTRWAQLQAAGRVDAGVADVTPVTVSWHWTTIAALSVLLVASAVALAAA